MIAMGLLLYIKNRLTSMEHNEHIQNGAIERDGQRQAQPIDPQELEERLREDVRRYEDDLRELAQT